MATEERREHGECRGGELERIIVALGEIRQKVDEVSSQLEDQYRLLREVHEAVERENGPEWYDLYEMENGFE